MKIPISGLLRDSKAFKFLINTCWLENTPGHWLPAKREGMGSNQVSDHLWLPRGDCMGSSVGPGGRGILTCPSNPEPSERTLSLTKSLLQALPLCLPSLRNVLVKVKQVNSEREQWIVALVHCYANDTQIGVLNLALMMPSCFVFQLPWHPFWDAQYRC